MVITTTVTKVGEPIQAAAAPPHSTSAARNGTGILAPKINA